MRGASKVVRVATTSRTIPVTFGSFPSSFPSLSCSFARLSFSTRQLNGRRPFFDRQHRFRAFSSSGSGDGNESKENDESNDESGYKEDAVPESFFDEEEETRKQFLELTSAALTEGGVANLTRRVKKNTPSVEFVGNEDKNLSTSGDIGEDITDLSREEMTWLLTRKGHNEDVPELDKESKLDIMEILKHLDKDGVDPKLAQVLEKGSERDIMETLNEMDNNEKKGAIPFQEYPRNDKDVGRFIDVDKHPNSFPSFSEDQRRELKNELSRSNINLNEDEEDLGPYEVDEMAEDFVLPREYANYSMPARSTDAYPEPLLEKFMPDTAEEKYRFDSQGNRSCPGKRQRKGKEGNLYCHRIDLSTLHYLDTVNLARFIAADSSIMGRKGTGLCSKCQRAVAKTIKRARNFGILPRIGEYVLQDSQPRRKAPYHVRNHHVYHVTHHSLDFLSRKSLRF